MIKSIVAYLNYITCMHVTIYYTKYTYLVNILLIKYIKETYMLGIYVCYSKIYSILH